MQISEKHEPTGAGAAAKGPGRPIGLTYQQIKGVLPNLLREKVPLMKRGDDGTFIAFTTADISQLERNPSSSVYVHQQALDGFITRFSGGTPAEASDALLRKGWPRPAILPLRSVPDIIFDLKLKELRLLSVSERMVLLKDAARRLARFIRDQSSLGAESFFDLEKIMTLVFCLNKIMLEDSLVQAFPPDALKVLSAETGNITEQTVRFLLARNTDNLGMEWIDCVQTGSGILDHVGRVYFLNLLFLKFYGEYCGGRSGGISNFQGSFKERFFPYYFGLIRDKQYVTLSHVFKNGLARISDASLSRAALSALLHDIGAQPEHRHFDELPRSDARHAVKNERHALQGYATLVRSKTYSWDVSSTALLHHEYYGAPVGYAQTATFQSTCSMKDSRASVKDRGLYCLSFDLLDLVQGNARAWFPHKTLEMIDLFDRLSSPDPVSDERCAPDKILALMRKEYLEEGRPALDPVLFDIFIDFLAETCKSPYFNFLKI